MSNLDVPESSSAFTAVSRHFKSLLILLVFALLAMNAMAQSANLDQGANGKNTAPDNPVNWVNGNLNSNAAHFLEGLSVPYRAILTNLTVNKTYTLVVALDVRNGGKHALDYITHFQRLESHIVFGHAAETVNPLLNITGFPVSYFTSTDQEAIPVPSVAGSPVPGQPAASFNALPPAERMMTGYNADLVSVVYASEGSLTAAQSETVINITFKALKATVVLAWGGHIASVEDWGKNPVTGESNSASGINGSPYHMRLKNWIIDGNVVSIGNQDRSLKTDAVFVPPHCTVSGPDRVCAETPSLVFTSTIDDPAGVSYVWSIIGSNTAGAAIVNNTLANIQVVPAGTTFNVGTFNLRLIVTRNGLSDTCYLGGHDMPGLDVTVVKTMVNAGSDQSITHLDTAYLSASASGGVAPYAFSWSPETGLSDPHIFNPSFVPPSAGVYTFIVSVADSIGCMARDTVVITVTEHPHPPCVIDGPDPVCPGSANVYTGPPPADVSFYSWSVTGNASITGATNGNTVTVLAGSTCGAYTLQLITATPDGKVKDTCMRTIQVKDTIVPVLNGTAPDAAVACAKDVPAAPGIGVTDNCQADMKVDMREVVTDSTCVNKFRIVRKWWATDACGNTSDTLTQVITVNDDVKPVVTADFEKEVSVQCLSDIPALPSPTATDNCEGALTPAYSESGSGTACDSVIVRTWVFTDACGNSETVTQTVRVKDTAAPVLKGNAANMTVACAKDVPAPESITADDNCGYAKVYFSTGTTDSTCVNKFTLLRKWWAVDACGNVSDTLRQTITVYDNIRPEVTGRAPDKVLKCGTPVTFDAPSFTDNCGGDVTVITSDRKEGTACPFTYIRQWKATDACGNITCVEQAVTVGCCESYCTYTQGFYGNKGGLGCVPGGGSLTAKAMMSLVMDAQVGDSAVFGLKSTGRFFTLFLSDITSDNIFKMLPGGGTPVALKGYGTFSKTATWATVPLLTTKANNGKINNVLLSQTMALFFNMGITGTLGGLPIAGDSLFTAKLSTCGGTTPVDKVDTFLLPKSVVTYLTANGQASVAGLFSLANNYLGGQTVSGVSISDVNAAVDAINNAFDKCAVLVGWASSAGISAGSLNTVSLSRQAEPVKAPAATAPKVDLTVYPNPYADVIIFSYVAPETGHAQLVLYNVQGQRIAVLQKGTVMKGSEQRIQYQVPDAMRMMLIYKLTVGHASASGKLVPGK